MTPAEQVAASRIAMYAALRAQAHDGIHAPLQVADTVLTLVKHMGDAELAPTARRHPIALVVGCAVLGAILVQTRPWRLLTRPWVVQSLLAAYAVLTQPKSP
ncbi:hypothetical protein [Rhodoferax sp.]|jgi:hypothetical protein|uniref:hypothetical protein n=1 Tax=Rhodoferax sp. TaxID=50421 RepID=UPI003783A5D6